MECYVSLLDEKPWGSFFFLTFLGAFVSLLAIKRLFHFPAVTAFLLGSLPPIGDNPLFPEYKERGLFFFPTFLVFFF